MSENNLASALAKAQASMENAKLNKVNPHFKSKYADLSAIREATQAALAENEFAITQTIEIVPGDDVSSPRLILATTLRHVSGETVRSEYPLPWAPEKPQIMGSAITYARRYSLASMMGISAEEDDDANAAQTNEIKHQAGDPQRIKTEVKKEGRKWAEDLRRCSDDDELTAFLATTTDIQRRIQNHVPEWWYHEEGRDPPGFDERIRLKKEELAAKGLNEGFGDRPELMP